MGAFKRFLSKPDSSWIFIGIALALEACIAFVFLSHRENPARHFGYAIGNILFAGLIGGWILHKTLLKNFIHNKALGFSLLALIAASLHFVAVSAFVFMAHQEKQAAKNIASEIRSYMDTNTAVDSSKEAVPTYLSPDAQNLAKIQALVREHMQALKTAAEEYTAGVEVVMNVLTPQVLSDQEKLPEALLKVETFENTIHAYFARVEEIQKGTRAKAEAMVMNEKFKAAFLQGMDNTSPAGAQLMARLKANQLALAAKFKEILVFAQKSKVGLDRDGTLRFKKDKDISNYNVLVTELEALAKEEENIVKEIQVMQEATKQKLDKLAQ